MSRRIYILLVIARTGSTWLCSMLKSTGIAGSPCEHLWYRYEGQILHSMWDSHKKEDPFGTKITYFELVNRIWPLLSEEEKKNCRFVWMRRNDRIAQAVSRYRSFASGVWSLAKHEEKPRKEYQEVLYEERKILLHIKDIVKAEEQARVWFNRHNVPVLTTWYEDIVESPEKICREVLDFLDLDSTIPIVTDRFKKLGDKKSAEWIGKIRTASL